MKQNINELKFKELIKRIPIVNNCKIDNEIATLFLKENKKIKIRLFILEPGYPKQVLDFIQNYNSELYCVILATYISEQTEMICRNHNFGYLDLAGNCFLSIDSLYIEIKGNKNKNISKRALKSVYEKSATVSSVILRNMLEDVQKTWKLNELALQSQCSIGQVSKVKTFLLNRLLIEQTKDGIKIKDAKKIMEEWATVYNDSLQESVMCYSLDSIPNIEEKIAKMKEEIGIDCILTGFSGGARYQPIVRYQKVHAIIDYKDIEKAIQYLGLKKVSSGANVVFLIKENECIRLFSREINKNRVASPVQIYLDSMGLKGRGEELAEAILEREICK